MRIMVAVLLVLHGLITAAQSATSFGSSSGVANPKWLAWWPTPLGKSWLGVEGSFLGILAGFLWLLAGAALVAAGFGLFGFIVPAAWWRVLAGAGAVLSLVLFAVYAHPFYAIGIAADLAILIALLWLRFPSPQVLGS